MSIYSATYPYYADELEIVDLGDGKVKIVKELNKQVIGRYVVAWIEGLEGTMQLLVSDSTPDIARCYIRADVLRELLTRLNDELVLCLWYAVYSGLVGRFLKLLLSGEDAREYMKQRIGAIVMLRTMGKIPVARNLEKILQGNSSDCLRGYIGIYKTAVSFKSNNGAMILNDGLQVIKTGHSEIDAERLYAIFDPLIDDNTLQWWCELVKECEIVELYNWEET